MALAPVRVVRITGSGGKFQSAKLLCGRVEICAQGAKFDTADRVNVILSGRVGVLNSEISRSLDGPSNSVWPCIARFYWSEKGTARSPAVASVSAPARCGAFGMQSSCHAARTHHSKRIKKHAASTRHAALSAHLSARELERRQRSIQAPRGLISHSCRNHRRIMLKCRGCLA